MTLFHLQSIEFTLQNNVLCILESRCAKRTPRAAVHIAVSMVREGLINEREALLRMEPAHMGCFARNSVHPSHVDTDTVVGTAQRVAVGLATGGLVFSKEEALNFGSSCILCLPDMHHASAASLAHIPNCAGVLVTAAAD